MVERTVADCFYQIRNGANIKQGVVDGGYPITRIETTANDCFNRDRMGYAGITDLGKYESYVLEDGDLLMSHINSVQYLGRTVLYCKQGAEKIIHGMNLLDLKADRNVILPAFAKYYFYSPVFREQIGRITKKSVNQASFAVADLKKLIIKTPTIPKQAEIIDVLDRVNHMKATRQTELQKLDELVKARFVEMFGDSEFNTKAWPIQALDELCDVGSSKRIYQNEQSQAGVQFWRISDLVSKMDTGTADSRLYISEERYKELKQTGLVPIPGDILVTSRGTLGRCYIIKDEDRFYFQDGMISWLSDYADSITPLYLQYLFMMPGFRKQIDSMQAGSTVAYLSIAMLKKLRVMVPPIEVQKTFASFVTQLDKSKFTVQKALDEAQLLFDSLMQKYFG